MTIDFNWRSLSIRKLQPKCIALVVSVLDGCGAANLVKYPIKGPRAFKAAFKGNIRHRKNRCQKKMARMVDSQGIEITAKADVDFVGENT